MKTDTHSPVSETKACEAGAPEEFEIEVTPEMIEAGVSALRSDYQPYFESEGDGVRKIFTAMMRVAPLTTRRPPP